MEDPDSDPHLLFLQILASIFTGSFSLSSLIVLLIILVLILASAMISGAEIAFFSLNPIELKELKSKVSKTNSIILSHLKIPKRLLATILITNNFINVGIVILSAYLISSLFDFASLPVLGFLIKVVAITIFILLFGEIMPKIYANQKPLVFASIMARPLGWLIKLFYPISSLLVRSTNFIDKKLASQNREITMSELSEAIDITADDNAPIDETKILKGIVKFTDIEVSEIMKSRMDVVSIDSELDFVEVIKVVTDSGYSRIPVYTETFDKIDGVLYVRICYLILIKRRILTGSNY